MACADAVLLNKCDLASQDLIQRTERTIRALNDSIPIHRTIRGELSLEKILNLDAFHSRPQLVIDYGQFEHDHHDSEGHSHDHFRGVTSLTIPLPVLSPTHESILDEWLRRLLWDGIYEDKSSVPTPVESQSDGVAPDQPNANQKSKAVNSETKPKILRCKGVYWTQRGDQVIVQGVQTLYETTVVGHGNTAETGKMVLIGTGLGEEIKSSLLQSLEGA